MTHVSHKRPTPSGNVCNCLANYHQDSPVATPISRYLRAQELTILFQMLKVIEMDMGISFLIPPWTLNPHSGNLDKLLVLEISKQKWLIICSSQIHPQISGQTCSTYTLLGEGFGTRGMDGAVGYLPLGFSNTLQKYFCQWWAHSYSDRTNWETARNI